MTTLRPATLGLLALGALGLLAPAASAQPRRLPIPIRGPGGGAASSPLESAIARGDEALAHDDFTTAQREFESAARLAPTDARPAFYLGEVALRQQQWAPAEAHFRDAVRLNPRMAEAHAELGSVLRETNRAADAQASLRTAINLDPTLGSAHYTLALLLEDAGQADQAVGEYREAVRLLADDPLPKLNLGILLANRRPAADAPEHAEALRLLRDAVRLGAGQRDVLLGAGPAFRLLGDANAAVDALQRALALGAPTASLYAELAQALWAAGNRPLALQRAGEAVQADGQRAEFRYIHGLMLAETGDRAAAAAELEQAARLAGDTPLAQRARQHLEQLRAASPSPSPAPAANHPPRRGGARH